MAELVPKPERQQSAPESAGGGSSENALQNQWQETIFPANQASIASGKMESPNLTGPSEFPANGTEIPNQSVVLGGMSSNYPYQTYSEPYAQPYYSNSPQFPYEPSNSFIPQPVQPSNPFNPFIPQPVQPSNPFNPFNPQPAQPSEPSEPVHKPTNSQPERKDVPHQPTQVAHQTKDPGLFRDTLYATVAAMSARIGYMGLRGTLLVDNKNLQSYWSRQGSYGKELLDRWGSLQSQGWDIGRASLTDLSLRGVSPVMMSRLGGFNDSATKTLAYTDTSSLSGVTTFGRTNPLKSVSSFMAHEFAHADGIPIPDDWQRLPEAEQKIVASRLLETETNGIMSQLRMDQITHNASPNTLLLRENLKQGTLGQYIKKTWEPGGGHYDTLKLYSDEEANRVVNTHLRDVYGPDIIKPGGKVGDFALSDVYGKYTGQLPGDEEKIAKMWRPADIVQDATLAPESSAFLFSHAGQALTGVGLALILTGAGPDLVRNPKKGVGDLGRIGLDWGAYEGGSRAGFEGATIAQHLLGIRGGGGLAMTVSLVAGLGLAGLTDWKVSRKAANAIENAL